MKNLAKKPNNGGTPLKDNIDTISINLNCGCSVPLLNILVLIWELFLNKTKVEITKLTATQ